MPFDYCIILLKTLTQDQHHDVSRLAVADDLMTRILNILNKLILSSHLYHFFYFKIVMYVIYFDFLLIYLYRLSFEQNLILYCVKICEKKHIMRSHEWIL